MVPGVPVPKGRPRWSPRGTYTPASTVQGEYNVQAACFAANPRLRPIAGRFRLECTFYLPGGQRSDWDNLGKEVSDALNGAVWLDDRQIAEAQIKVLLWQTEPRSEISVWLIEIPSQSV